jgi:hypothetical protein
MASLLGAEGSQPLARGRATSASKGSEPLEYGAFLGWGFGLYRPLAGSNVSARLQYAPDLREGEPPWKSEARAYVIAKFSPPRGVDKLWLSVPRRTMICAATIRAALRFVCRLGSLTQLIADVVQKVDSVISERAWDWL